MRRTIDYIILSILGLIAAAVIAITFTAISLIGELRHDRQPIPVHLQTIPRATPQLTPERLSGMPDMRPPASLQPVVILAPMEER